MIVTNVTHLGIVTHIVPDPELSFEIRDILVEAGCPEVLLFCT